MMFPEFNTEEGNFNWAAEDERNGTVNAPEFTYAEYVAGPEAVHEKFRVFEAERAARYAVRCAEMDAEKHSKFAAFENYENACFEAFSNFGVMFVREFYHVRWV